MMLGKKATFNHVCSLEDSWKFQIGIWYSFITQTENPSITEWKSDTLVNTDTFLFDFQEKDVRNVLMFSQDNLRYL